MTMCDTCDHPVRDDHGMQFTMRGVCEECPDCIAESIRLRDEDRLARPAQYRPIVTTDE